MKFAFGIVGSKCEISYTEMYFIKSICQQFELEILEIDNIPLFNQ